MSRDTRWSLAKAGFEARLPLARLRDREGNWRYGSWVLAVGAVTARGVARGGLRLGPDAYRADLVPIALDEDAWLVPTVTNGVIGFRLEPADLSLVTCHLQDGKLVLTGRVAHEVTKDAVVTLGLVTGISELTVPVEPLPDSRGHHMLRATIDLADVVDAVSPVSPVPIGGQPDRLLVGVRVKPGDLTPHPFACDPEFGNFSASVAGHRVAVQATGDGWLALTVRRVGPTLESVSWTEDGELLMRGSGADLVPQMLLVGRHSGYKQQRLLPCEVSPAGSWESRIHPESVPQVGGRSALRAGNWFMVLRTPGQDGAPVDCDLPFAPELFAGAAHFRIPHGERYSFKRVGLDGVALRIESRLRENERSAYHSQRLRDHYYPTVRVREPLRDVVVYDSFNGKQYSDSPRAVHEELLARGANLEHIWVTRDAQAPVPADTRTVEANSREYFEALATSRYVVANTHLPPWFQRREGQVVAQTWHGIGFKRVAFDMDSVQFANKTYLEKLVLEAPNWSFLVSPSAFCTEIMRRAFRYDGEIAEIGSPRNDILFVAEQAAAADQIRAELGIAPGRKLLLYAPTWRDNEYYGPGMYKFNMQLDVTRLPEWVKKEYALLVRRHPNTVDDLLGFDSDFVYDVANYPDARDLLAAADVLISDYSTIALDFVNTGRPIIFYTYDLENYRDNLRGFYFDLENEGPGPVLQTTAEVVEALADLDRVRADYATRYQRFKEIYCHAEDGAATARLVDRLLRDA
jgi:CDP-glycerol glycerophosphotransferase